MTLNELRGCWTQRVINLQSKNQGEMRQTFERPRAAQTARGLHGKRAMKPLKYTHCLVLRNLIPFVHRLVLRD